MRVIDINLWNVLIIGVVGWLFRQVMLIAAARWPNKVLTALAS